MTNSVREEIRKAVLDAYMLQYWGIDPRDTAEDSEDERAGNRPLTNAIADAILPIFTAALSSERARAEEAEKHRDQARADLEKLLDPELKHLRLENGELDMGVTGPIVQHIGLVLAEHFRASGAQNYIEMSFNAKSAPFETYVWTIQKTTAKTPHMLREEAEARATTAESERDALREAVEKAAAHFDFLAKILRETKTLKEPGGKVTPTWKVAAFEAEAGAAAIRASTTRTEGGENGR